ncbi:MAG: putative metallopeptidase [Thermosphaera sp.]
MIKYFWANDVSDMIKDIVSTLQPELQHIDLKRIVAVRSVGSKSRAIARVHGFPRIYSFVLGVEPIYVIEVISEGFDNLPVGEKVKVLIHELLHVPRNLKGGLRPHGRLVNGREVLRLYRIFIERKSRKS